MDFSRLKIPKYDPRIENSNQIRNGLELQRDNYLHKSNFSGYLADK